MFLTNQPTQQKIESIRKNILHNVLQYNLQSSTERRHDEISKHQT